ncbi:MAG: right-handed parallel beta-helix repeat-containing protein [Bacteroidetes bacterium]|nr:MAG: right-handed parallel beta-helix repeat-containing protein [Bacteroidota bacterium]
MRKIIKQIVFITFSFLGLFFLDQCTKPVENSGISPGHTTYYINPETGDDENSGLKENRAWRTFSHINQLQLAAGDRVEITSPGSFDQTFILKGEGSAENPVEVHFAAGRYDFYTDNITRKKYNISNTNSQPDSLKSIGILLEGAKHFNISGPGAEIIYRGKMIEVCIDSCENISVSDLHFDYHRPTVSEFQVVAVGEDHVDLQIHKDSEYRIEDGNLIWYGEGWTCNTRILGQELNLETNDVKRLWNPIEGMQFEELEPNLVRARGAHKVKKDHVYQLRETFRDYAAVFTRRSKNITWKNVDFYFLHGMGLVSQFSENLTYDAVSIAPDSTSGRTTAACADILHISGCKGKVLVKDCIFKGAHDDAINIHGTYLQVVEKVSENQIKLRFMHHQTYGFMAVNPGDEIEFVDAESYESHGLNRVKDAIMLSPKEIMVTLESSVPGELELGDAIENVTWTPEVEIRGCHVSWIPTRGFLLATRKKVLVEENVFFATHMSAILLGIDANKWFESGYVRDMTIRNNKFVSCAEPVIHIEPRNIKANNSVHQNIKIENNQFILRNHLVLQAKSASNISITANTIISEKELNDDDIAVLSSDCSDLVIRNNQYRNGSE